MKRSILKTALSLTIMVVLLITCTELEKEILVTTGEITNIQVNSVEASGSLVDLGEGVNQHGHYYSKSSDPAKDILHTTLGKPEGAGGFISQVESLEAGTKYYIVAYATGNKGNSFGDIKSFTTLPAKIPVLGTNEIIAITTTSATCGGNITDEGGAPVTARGICWGTTTIPTLEGNKTIAGSGTGGFSGSMTGLTPGARYYVRAYATNSAGTGYGPEKSFVTIAAALPVISINSVTDITKITAVSGGNITSDGGMPVMARGVCLNTTGNPTTTDNKTFDGTGTGSFVSNLTGLTQGTKYYLRAYAGNYAGTAYSEEISFTTVADATKPTIETVAITAITQTTANSGGNVTSDGGTPVTERGMCWNTVGSPTTADSKKNEGSGTGTFVSSLTGLTPSTTYYLRAYAINGIETAYGTEVSFTTSTLVPVIPTLITISASSITQTTATVGGDISNDGGASVIERGICWSTSANPTSSLTTRTSEGNGTGAFTSSITGLTANTTYYVRAYATNSVGTAYGTEISLTTKSSVAIVTTTPVSLITQTTATSGGNISDDGGEPVTARGVCWSTSINPTAALATKTSDGIGTGAFSSSISGLNANTTYYVRAYAINSAGISYSNQDIFTTSAALPTVTTTAATLITGATASSGGIISSDGGAAVTERGVCWSTSINPTTSLTTKTSDGTGSGTFLSSLTGLIANTTYYARAYAINSSGTAYGVQISFTTTANLPSITTTEASYITQTTAASGGNITNDGGALVTARGVCWNTSINPTTDLTTKTSEGTGTGTFISALSGLSVNTTYYLRAYATNSAGTVYGAQVMFTTTAYLPVLTTTTASSITITSASSGGNISSNGGATVTSRGICWSTSPNPTTALTTKTSEGPGSGIFTSSVTGLTASITYYIRSYAINIAGTAYGDEISFRTKDGTLTDIDGNTYNTITIGTQVWMTENLKTTRYKDGTAITLVTDQTAWRSLSTPGYCYYNNDGVTLRVIYGALYNYYAVNTSKLCPNDWHVPNHAEWTTLTTYLGGQSVAGGKLKEIGTTHWQSPNTGATNESGFTGLPGGSRFDAFGTIGQYGMWYSTTFGGGYSYFFTMTYSDSNLSTSAGDPRYGASVRCLRDF